MFVPSASTGPAMAYATKASKTMKNERISDIMPPEEERGECSDIVECLDFTSGESCLVVLHARILRPFKCQTQLTGGTKNLSSAGAQGRRNVRLATVSICCKGFNCSSAW